MARLTPAPNQWTRTSPAPSPTPASKKEGRRSRFREEMVDERDGVADETEPLLSYHEIQRERTEQLLANAEETASLRQHNDDEDGYTIDHGKVAWMQVLGGFILFANSW
jgi:hypothetical protein